MRALVVYESIYGNTHALAEAIAEGLRPAMEADVRPVSDAADGASGFDLVVAGGPTHMHGMATNTTRKMAVKAAGEEGQNTEPGADEGPGLRSWLRDQHSVGGLAAAYDSRADASPVLTGMAARGIAKRLRKAGFELVDHPRSFLVTDSEGPLADGELDRAREWGAELGAAVNERQPALTVPSRS